MKVILLPIGHGKDEEMGESGAGNEMAWKGCQRNSLLNPGKFWFISKWKTTQKKTILQPCFIFIRGKL